MSFYISPSRSQSVSQSVSLSVGLCIYLFVGLLFVWESVCPSLIKKMSESQHLECEFRHIHLFIYIFPICSGIKMLNVIPPEKTFCIPPCKGKCGGKFDRTYFCVFSYNDMSVDLSAGLSICRSVCPSVRPSVCLSVRQPVCPSLIEKSDEPPDAIRCWSWTKGSRTTPSMCSQRTPPPTSHPPGHFFGAQKERSGVFIFLK